MVCCFQSEPDEQACLGDLREAIKHCMDQGMLKLRFYSPDGFHKNVYNLAPLTQWKSYN